MKQIKTTAQPQITPQLALYKRKSKYHLFTTLLFMCITALSFAQQPKWNIYNSEVDYVNGTSTPLPIAFSPDYTQNALWDVNDNLVFYENDGVIYDAQGSQIIDFSFQLNNQPKFVKGFSEFLIIPVPGSCSDFYGIISYAKNGNATNINKLLWTRLNVDFSTNIVTVIPQNGNLVESTDLICADRTRNTEDPDGTNPAYYATLLEASAVQPDGNRKVFVTTHKCLLTFNATATGLSMVDGYQVVSQLGDPYMFYPYNLRTELEAYDHGNETFDVVTPLYEAHLQSTPLLYGDNKFSVISVDFSSAIPVYNQSDYNLPLSDVNGLIKGVEFSENGLHLYLSITQIDPTNGSVINAGSHVIYYSRPSLTAAFTYGGTISAGSSESDFAYGMIEKGMDGKIYVAGDQRLGTLADNNNPSSTWNPNAVSIGNTLTQAVGYESDSPPSPVDIEKRKIYLLVDQVDNDPTSNWVAPDFFPNEVTLCALDANNPYVLQANQVINWSVTPDDDRINPTPPYSVFNQQQISITEPGVVVAYFPCHTETINVVLSPYANYSADFNWVFTNNGSSVDLSATPIHNDPFYNKIWTLEELVNGTWTFVTVAVNPPNPSSTVTFTGLNTMSDYRITLVLDQNNTLPSNCLQNIYSSFADIFTGGRVYQGTSTHTQFQNIKE